MTKAYFLNEKNEIQTARKFKTKKQAIEFCQRRNRVFFYYDVIDKKIWRTNLSYINYLQGNK